MSTEPAQSSSSSFRFPLWAIVALVVAVLLSVTAVVVSLTRDSSLEQGAGPPETSEPAPEPAPAEVAVAPADLMAFVPPELVDCIEADVGTASFDEALALVVCAPPPDVADVGFVEFDLFPSAEAANVVFQSYIAERGLAPDSGDCASGVAGEQSWSGAEGQGRLACREELDQPSLVWTSDGFPILGRVSDLSGSLGMAEVYAIWQALSDYPR